MTTESHGFHQELEVVTIDDLNVDHRYQRPLSQDLVERILADWDPRAADAITVSRRKPPTNEDGKRLTKAGVRDLRLAGDGTLWIINGQHETMAAKLAGETEMLAFTHEGLTLAEEADLRLKKNNRRSDTSQERFHAQVTKGVPETLAIKALLEKYATHYNRTPNQHSGVNAVSTLELLYREDSEVLERTLKAIRETYGSIRGDQATTRSLRSIFWFLKVHVGEYQWKSLVERISRVGYDEIHRRAMSHKASARGPDWLNHYRAIVELYNYKRPEHTRLEQKTKYSSSLKPNSWTRERSAKAKAGVRS